MSPSERFEVLLEIREVVLVFSSTPAQYGVSGETYYWTAGYHLNIRLYEKLLFGLFDVLEEGQLIEVCVFPPFLSFSLVFVICTTMFIVSFHTKKKTCSYVKH